MLPQKWPKLTLIKYTSYMECLRTQSLIEIPFFLSNFWQELFSLHGTDLNLSSTYHPHSDGQTEVLNRCLETYLRCFCSYSPNDWYKWLPAEEFWYNTSYHTTLKTSPYEIPYRRSSPIHLPYLPRESKVDEFDRTLAEREEVIAIIKQNLFKVQNRMKQQADAKRT
ncbi:hypothetical protein RND81_14G145000 [Saponaria officinalis]|uniref:Integrase catalytic domain-containing protein n=1 Tax=Saponaria officinalis TaxID=3572 RepID=A0AAW1GM45_SAPOF